MTHIYRAGEEAIYVEYPGREHDVVILEDERSNDENINMRFPHLGFNLTMDKKSLRPKVKVKTGLTKFLEKHEEKSSV